MPLYIGLISGTSADGIDAALVDVRPEKVQLIAHHDLPFSEALRQRIHQLCAPGDNEIDLLGALDRELGQMFAEASLTVIEKSGHSTQDIVAIGSHGQTLRHRPPGQTDQPFTLQVGDPNQIAHLTGITTVADFRRRDMAAGGQGAPLVPAFHQAVFASAATNRAIVNIGGIANISWLAPANPILGFDTGPGNTLMDAWTLRHLGQAYDADGHWARQGNCCNELLAQLLKHPYLAKAIPKSSGREDFHLPWLDTELAQWPDISPVDVQATLLELTVQTIANHLQQCPGVNQGGEVYICGGGARNGLLMQRLKEALPQFCVTDTNELGIAPDWVEASAFAWLAYRTLAGLTGSLASVTGASQDAILGGIYPGAR